MPNPRGGPSRGRSTVSDAEPRGPGGGRAPDPDERRRQLKIAGFGALALLGLIFVVQNSASTEIRLLWWSVRMPQVFALLAMIGLGIGLDRAWQWRRRRR